MSLPGLKRDREGERSPREVEECDAPASMLQAMVDHVAEAVAMFDANQRLVAWNRQLPAILDVPASLLTKQTTFEQFIRFMGERGDFGADRDEVEAAIRDHIGALDRPSMAERMLPDGRILEFRRDPLPNGAFVVTYRDVSEARHNEYLLKDSTRELRAILEKAPVALAVIGQADRQLKHVNARFRKLFGLGESQAAERTALDRYLSREDRNRILSAQPDRRSVDFETEVRRADGTTFWALISSVRFIFEWEPATLTSFHDISDRRRAEAGLMQELERKRGELREARTLQLELAPPPFRSIVGNQAISVDVALEPAKEVGGDLVDYFLVGDSLLVMILGDVSNKGAGAALMMARTHSLMRGIAARPDAEALFRAPEQAIRLANEALSKDNATCMFVTLLLASFDATNGNLAYVRAGHVPPFLRRAAGGIERLDAAGGPPLGLKADASHRSSSIYLRSGDQLLVVTDGITEATDAADNQFGEPRVEGFLSTIAREETHPLTRLTAAVRTFEAGQPAFDDAAAIFMTIADVVDD